MTDRPTAEDMLLDLNEALRLYEGAQDGDWVAFIQPGGVYEGQVHAVVQGKYLVPIVETPAGEDRYAELLFIAGAHRYLAAAARRALWAEGFKAWVHAWLDRAGVPTDPDPAHTELHGCRIAGRMNWLLGRIRAAEEALVRPPEAPQ